LKRLIAAIPLAIVPLLTSAPPQSSAARPSPSPTSTYTPMTVQYEKYSFRTSRTDCVGEDDSLTWKVAGSLKPGESFTFTPQKPDCADHPTAITVALASDSSQLQLSSVVPAADFTSNDPSQAGKTIVAPNVGTTAELCMFPAYPPPPAPSVYSSITVKNVGTMTASNVSMDGTDQNDWIENFYYRCMNADADRDGWNDSLEHTMGILTYYVPNASTTRYMGSNYLRSSGTSTPNDEVDFYPPDFNDDDMVDQTDVDVITAHLGEGTGVSLDQISPNPGDPTYQYNQALSWRRYDLDGDGYVDQRDVDIVKSLAGEPIPATTDTIAPTARITRPAGSVVQHGWTITLGAYAWDNAALTKVEFYVNGTLLCTQTKPNWTLQNYPLFSCGWTVPKKPGASYIITAKAYDGSGNTSSGSSTVTAQ
jgi:hypothetical protein